MNISVVADAGQKIPNTNQLIAAIKLQMNPIIGDSLSFKDCLNSYKPMMLNTNAMRKARANITILIESISLFSPLLVACVFVAFLFCVAAIVFAVLL